MKALRIEFIPDPFGKRLWLMASVGLFLSLSFWGYGHYQRSQVRDEIARQWSAVEQTRKHNAMEATRPLDAKKKRLQQISQALRWDINPVFAVIENVNVSGTLLKTMQLDNDSKILRLEFLLESPDKASLVSDALNSGNEQRPWILERVSTQAISSVAAGNPSTGFAQSQDTQFKTLGSWQIRLDRW